MKIFISFIKVSIGLVVFLFLSILFYYNVKEYRSKKQFDKIKIGMRVDEVVTILGEPAQIYERDYATYEYRYFSGVLGKSTEPSVVFDRKNTVIQATYGD